MFLITAKTLAAIGSAVAVTTTLFAAPAQAAAAGRAEVPSKHDRVVRFTAAPGQANTLVITVSGRTVTLDDRVAIKPGRGCKAVKGDRTRVRCTTSRKPTELSITLGNRNDKVFNKSAVPMVAEGGSGRDTLSGGSNRDRLFGGSGNDTFYGGASTDAVSGGNGDDTIYGGTGNDWLQGDAGHDTVHGQAGNDEIFGDSGNDRLNGGTGNDKISGGPGKDKISGGPGKDKIIG